MSEQFRGIKDEQWQEYLKLKKQVKEDIKILKKKLAQAKPELTEWIELNFGKVRE